MIVKKQYIPKRYRSKKLVNAGGGVAVGGSLTSSTSGSLVDMSAFLLADKFTSLFEYDEVNDAIKAKLPFYSEGEISAYGYGGSGGGGGTGIVYNGLDSTITDIALSAYMGNVLNTNKLEVSAFNSWVSNYVPPVPSWGDVTGKPSTFPATAHVHGWGEIENKPTTFAPSAHTHTWDSITSKPNVITGTTASFTTELKTKLSGIAAGANNYTHPATHAPSIIAQDANNRFVTDANIATWNAKANGTHTHNLSEIGITGLSANYLPKYNGSTLVNSILIDNGNSLSVLGGINLESGANKSIVGRTATAWYYSLKWEDNDFLIQDYEGTNFIKASYGSPKNLTILDNLFVQQNGNVGIGTTNPTSKLEVAGAIKSSALYVSTEITANDYIQSNGAVYALAEMQSPQYKLGNGWDIRASGAEIQFFYNGVKKGGFSTNGFYSTGEITAYT